MNENKEKRCKKPNRHWIGKIFDKWFNFIKNIEIYGFDVPYYET
jgi:hypothetical protein